MNKQEFLKELEAALHGMPKEDVAERIGFYSEIIELIRREPILWMINI